METSSVTSTSQTDPDYYTKYGQPIYVQSHMLQTMSTKSWNIPGKSKPLLEFSIGLHYTELNQKVLLKVDTGSNINCISLGTFHELFPNQQLNRSMLLLENYGNSPVTVIGKGTAFIRWKGKVFHQEFHITNANSSPNLLSRYYRLVSQLKEKNIHNQNQSSIKTTSVSKIEETSQSTKSHKKMEECIPLIQCSTDQGSVSKLQLTKQKILDVYADVFEGLGTFPGEPYKFKLKLKLYACKTCTQKVPVHLQDDFHEEINDLVKQGVLGKSGTTEWVNSFVIVEKDVSMESGNSHAPHHQFRKKLQICLDPRDLNEALKHKPYSSRSGG